MQTSLTQTNSRHNANAIADYIIRFTDTYKKHTSNQIESRELACLNQQYPFFLREIEPGDLFAGRIRHQAVGFAPQMGSGFGYYLLEDKFDELINSPEIDADKQKQLLQIKKFWETENNAAKTRAAYTQEMSAALPSDNWNGESGIGFPLYRMSGTHLDYDTLLQLGIPGMRERIRQKIPAANKKAQTLYQSMLGALDLLAHICLWYADMAEQIASVKTSAKHHDELLILSRTLKYISANKPKTFRQAVQLFFLYNLISGSANYGRMDEYLGDFYVQDILNERIDSEQAVRLLQSLWVLMNEREDRMWQFDSRVIIGGLGRRNPENADALAFTIMETTRRVKDIMPQLTLRFHQHQNPQLYTTALDIISEGNPYPMLYNDDVNIPSVRNAFNISAEEAENYVPFGCGEYVIYHKSVGTPSGVINLLQALLVTLHKGINPTTGLKMGLAAEETGDFHSFADLYSAYQKQVEYYVTWLARQEELEYAIAGENAPYLFMSMLFDDCIDRGKAVFSGGVRYLGGTLETYGNSNTADSLSAIKQLVFKEKSVTINQLVNMLDANFAGYAGNKKQCVNVQKYGNDDAHADAMLVEVDRHVSAFARDQRLKTGLHSYLVVIINNNANTVMGRYTCASPDGRSAFSPMNNGNAPSSGADKSGVTAFLNSIVKPDPAIHAGAVQNMKFSRDLFINHREKLEALLETFFDNGGAQAMITVVNKGDLEDAILHPENYQNLIVRVGGFSARFVELAPDIQQEILARTLY